MTIQCPCGQKIIGPDSADQETICIHLRLAHGDVQGDVKGFALAGQSGQAWQPSIVMLAKEEMTLKRLELVPYTKNLQQIRQTFSRESLLSTWSLFLRLGPLVHQLCVQVLSHSGELFLHPEAPGSSGRIWRNLCCVRSCRNTTSDSHYHCHYCHSSIIYLSLSLFHTAEVHKNGR